MKKIETQYLCDRCHKPTTKNGIGGKGKKTWFRVGVEDIAHTTDRMFYRQLVMCPDCWMELEKVFKEYMKDVK